LKSIRFGVEKIIFITKKPQIGTLKNRAFAPAIPNLYLCQIADANGNIIIRAASERFQ